MSVHAAQVSWESDGGFADGTYSRAHDWRFDGGQTVRASSSPQVVAEPQSDPFGVDPEEALVAAIASCHMLWFLDLARRAGLDVTSYRDAAEGRMGRIAAGRMALTHITLRPDIGFGDTPPDDEAVAALHREAHERCFIANSLKTEVIIAPVAAAT